MDKRCTATTKSGQRCSAAAWQGGLCRWHSPLMAEKLAEGRRKGGAAKSNANRARKQLPAGHLTPDELRGILGSSIAKVLRGDIEPGVANSVSGLVKAYVAIDEAAKADELSRRLDDLERQARRGTA